MRTIGKRNITKLKLIVAEEMSKGIPDPNQVRDQIMQRIPDEWNDIWESAWSEIERMVSDEVWKILNSR